MRLLLVEDDVMAGAGMQLGLRQDGFVVDWVQDGLAAENALQSESYAVVILDLRLLRKNTLAYLEALHQRNRPIPVVFIDACGSAADGISRTVDLDGLAARIRAAARRQADHRRENTVFALPFSWR